MLLRTIMVVALLAGAIVGTTSPAQAYDTRTVRIESGWVRGTAGADHRVFSGIPFAAPPVGANRWRSPQPVQPWTGVRDATVPGDRCAQTTDVWGLPASDSEDCLYVSVTTPRPSPYDRPKPVMVWLHGGTLLKGAGSDYEPRRLAARGDVIVVTVNYRLGIFGFFGLPGLPDAGSFGLEDQVAALRWVKRNAAAFGGDPRNVTLFGESSGAQTACALLASPAATGLFQRVITQSGNCWVGGPAAGGLTRALEVPVWVPRAAHDAHGSALAAAAGCTDAATAVTCMRAKSTADLLAMEPLALPAYGTPVLPENPDQVFAEGRFHRVPMMTGIVRDEGTMFASLFFGGMTEQQYRDGLAGIFGEHAAAIEAEYPASAYPAPVQAAAALIGDLDWALTANQSDRLFGRQSPVYAYEFTDRTAPQLFPFAPDVRPLASHGSELSFLFGVTWTTAPLTTAQRELGDTMIAYWARFAATGDPNRFGLPAWPRVDAAGASPYVQRLDLGPQGIGSFDRRAEHNLAFWEGLLG
ncbi:carboxylesterase family protein [Spongiactinospora sp. TRM90649]|uniref:carboxylesterase/lipase family protein n=1 Tax=Spongiactinospora sp. TRM90649 TaxID=3031114 RepID=UPI0023F70069|nr:carboxylesterase family protein [Spongiactinospora sp. TRM90649]MDF5758954.1 carboxylesterase family protein [Spongiactinospora sp. TRM90649]